MQMMNVSKPIAFDVVICMSQLFDYYLFAVSINLYVMNNICSGSYLKRGLHCQMTTEKKFTLALFSTALNCFFFLRCNFTITRQVTSCFILITCTL